jgi:hypothetical protein
MLRIDTWRHGLTGFEHLMVVQQLAENERV